MLSVKGSPLLLPSLTWTSLVHPSSGRLQAPMTVDIVTSQIVISYQLVALRRDIYALFRYSLAPRILGEEGRTC
jgi:hypothetical protein